MKKQTGSILGTIFFSIALCACASGETETAETKTAEVDIVEAENTEDSHTLSGTTWELDSVTVEGILVKGMISTGTGDCGVSFDEDGNMELVVWGVTYRSAYQMNAGQLILEAEELSSYSIEMDGET